MNHVMSVRRHALAAFRARSNIRRAGTLMIVPSPQRAAPEAHSVRPIPDRSAVNHVEEFLTFLFVDIFKSLVDLQRSTSVIELEID